MKECHWLIPTSGGTDILFLTPATCHPHSPSHSLDARSSLKLQNVRGVFELSTQRRAMLRAQRAQRSKSGLVRRTRRLSCLCERWHVGAGASSADPTRGADLAIHELSRPFARSTANRRPVPAQRLLEVLAADGHLTPETSDRDTGEGIYLGVGRLALLGRRALLCSESLSSRSHNIHSLSKRRPARPPRCSDHEWRIWNEQIEGRLI